MIATVGADIPFDLLIATGRYAGPLSWSADKPTPQADAWLESKFAPWARSIMEDWAQGAFDQLESVIFSRSDDNSQRLYYYICELQSRGLLGGPRPTIFDVTLLKRRSSEQHLVAQVRKLADKFDLDDDTLERGIRESNVLRLDRARLAKTPAKGPTCLTTGTLPPDRRLHEMVESCGWNASGLTLGDLWDEMGGAVQEGTGDPAHAIGSQLHSVERGPRSQYDPAQRVVDDARSTGATAAILWYTEEEEALVWHLPSQRQALEAAGLPVLCLTRRNWAGRDGVDREIEDFLKGLTA